MSGTFTISIELGNEAMRTRDDVVDALMNVETALLDGGREGSIADDNGNRVGRWVYDNKDEEQDQAERDAAKGE